MNLRARSAQENFRADFPIDRDLKAVLFDDKLPQLHLKVFNYTRTPGCKCEMMLEGTNANYILPIPVDAR
jgi:hypothetical protein